MIKEGNPNSVSDAGVGALCARAAVYGAHMNVAINCKDIKDEAFTSKYLAASEVMKKEAQATEERLVKLVFEMTA
jgi:glutamate formiminotransferase/formiminotetrahydrofolate cyclodeaminase